MKNINSDKEGYMETVLLSQEEECGLDQNTADSSVESDTPQFCEDKVEPISKGTKQKAFESNRLFKNISPEKSIYKGGMKGERYKTIYIKKKKIVFWSPVPGSGAKETASNVAALLAKYTDSDICIIDLDFYNPGVSYLLNTETEVVENKPYMAKEKINSSINLILEDEARGTYRQKSIFSYLIQHPRYPKLFIATGVHNIPDTQNIDYSILIDFINKCYEEFDYVITVGAVNNNYHNLADLIKNCEEAYTVMEANLYSLETASRTISMINEICGRENDTFKIIVNKFDNAASIGTKDIRRGLGYPVVTAISYNNLHVKCRSTRKLFIEKCSEKLMNEYKDVLNDIGLIAKSRGRRGLFA